MPTRLSAVVVTAACGHEEVVSIFKRPDIYNHKALQRGKNTPCHRCRNIAHHIRDMQKRKSDLKFIIGIHKRGFIDNDRFPSRVPAGPIQIEEQDGGYIATLSNGVTGKGNNPLSALYDATVSHLSAIAEEVEAELVSLENLARENTQKLVDGSGGSDIVMV